MTHFPVTTRRTVLRAGSAALASSLLPLGALAQGGTVKFILPNAAGSGIDAITRAAQPGLAKALGTSVVVENQSGAAGVLGLQALVRSQPDGQTLSMVSNNVVIFPSVLKNLPFDMPGDFTPIAVVGATPLVLVVNPAKAPASDHRQFAALLKSRPGVLNYGSGGSGTILHLATEIYLDEAGAGGTARHIPYKGVGTMVNDLLGGQIDFATLALPSVQGHLKAGTLRAIGVMSAQRSPAAPDIPTLAEQGLAHYAVDGWFAVVGPKGLPPAQVQRIHKAVVSAFEDPGVKEAMAKQGNTVSITTPEQAQATFRKELARYAAIVRKVGLEPQ